MKYHNNIPERERRKQKGVFYAMPLHLRVKISETSSDATQHKGPSNKRQFYALYMRRKKRGGGVLQLLIIISRGKMHIKRGGGVRSIL